LGAGSVGLFGVIKKLGEVLGVMLRVFNTGMEVILGYNVSGTEELARECDEFLQTISGMFHWITTPEIRIDSFGNGPEQ